ncbi:MAG TPA: DbpA RNA binding domain-containing protein, partial [Gemmatimonadales bacterium]|nr:DbpA RNA binding domain-containing protein [Gemmatimonadales bacterium]
MPTLEDFHLLSPVATALEQLGWSADDPATRDATPTAARGHNLVGFTPPVPAYATPAVAGALSRVGEGKRLLLLSPAAQLEEWAGLVHRLAEGTSIRVHTARGTARAMRLLRSDAIDVLVATPDTASALVARSALTMEAVTTLFVAWPESWPDEEELTQLMQDLPKESQRIIYTADRNRVGPIIERYARKALTIGATTTPAASVGPVRTVGIPWSRRVSALADLVELLDPTSLAVWTVDRSYHEAIARTISVEEPTVQLVAYELPSASTVIAFDLPPAEQLRNLVTRGEVVLLVPPGTEGYVASIAGPRRPIQLPGAVDAARTAEGAQRATIVQTIEAGRLNRSVAMLAPLFERHDPVTVAAALYELWNSEPRAVPPPARDPTPTAKIYVGAGKKDGVTPNDLVAVLTKELRVDREKIGRIELRDGFS